MSWMERAEMQTATDQHADVIRQDSDHFWELISLSASQWDD